jgi:hypothetical protein
MAQTRFSGPVVSDTGFVGDMSLSTSVAYGNNAGSADLAETQNAIATLSAKVNAILAALGQ